MTNLNRTAQPPLSLSIALVWSLSCMTLGGCASSRLFVAPIPVKTPDLEAVMANPEGVTLKLHRIIRPNGGGSWVRNATWDEYVVTISNAASVPVAINRAELHSTAFPTPVRGGTSQDQLAAQSSAVHQTLKEVGLVGGGSVASAGLAAAAAGTGGGFVSAAAAAAIVVLPIALIGGTSYVVSRHHRAREDRPLIDSRILQRSLGMPTRLESAAQVAGSLFFPTIPDPDRLVIGYEVGSEPREISVTLPNRAELHAKAVRGRRGTQTGSSDSIAQ